MESSAFTGDVLAVETHAGRAWGLLILPAMIGPIVSTMFAPAPQPVRWALILVCTLGVGVLAITWGGFEYVFSMHGVEVRTLGFRLRSIPRDTIQSYAIEPWGLMRGGYGIRGIGRTRAYVWGNKVVHIRTRNGDVYLGHNEPERLVRDLDMVTGVVSRG